MNGKGDTRRPCAVSSELAGLRHELAFCRGDENERRRLAFIADLVEVYDRHGLALSHEDDQGAFIISERSQELIDWVSGARIGKHTRTGK